jgi:hypothetical protein
MEVKEKKITISLLTINNSTDRQYRYKSKNTFGLSWEYLDDGLLVIRQNMSDDGKKWEAMAHLKDFSIVEFIIRK